MFRLTPDDIFLTNVNGSNEDALQQLSELLLMKGYVSETYAKALIERERSYPTGIQLRGGVNVALPHADAEHVQRQALVIGIPGKPIKFHSMEDATKVIDAHIILLLVIKHPDGYVKFLANLTLLFQKEEFVLAVKEKRFEDLRKLLEGTMQSQS